MADAKSVEIIILEHYGPCPAKSWPRPDELAKGPWGKRERGGQDIVKRGKWANRRGKEMNVG